MEIFEDHEDTRTEVDIDEQTRRDVIDLSGHFTLFGINEDIHELHCFFQANQSGNGQTDEAEF